MSDFQTLLFLHIPKSGGTTFTTCLTNQYYNRGNMTPEISKYPELKNFLEGDIFYFPLGFYKDHSERLTDAIIHYLNTPGLNLVAGHFSYGIHNHIKSDTVYITLLRNPVERVVSLYYHLLKTGIIRKHVSLEEFIDGIAEEDWLSDLIKWYPFEPLLEENAIRIRSRCLVDNDQTRRISGVEPAFGHCDESMFKLACKNIAENFALVGITEKFDESLLLLADRLKWRKSYNYFPKLVNKRKPGVEKISDKLLTKIEELNRWDRKLYQFADAILEQKILESGPNFQKNLKRFRDTNKNFDKNNIHSKEWEI